MRQTGNDNLINLVFVFKIWFWGLYLVNKTIKYDKYALKLWISTELTPENHFYKAKMKIFKKCIPLACESVYREIFVPHRDTEIVLKTVRPERSVEVVLKLSSPTENQV